MRKFCKILLLFSISGSLFSATSKIDENNLKNSILGMSYSGTPWVFENLNEFENFELLRDETRDDYIEYFVYMSLRGGKACHNTLGLITVSLSSDEVLSVDMVHHAPSKRCLSYQEFKNP